MLALDSRLSPEEKPAGFSLARGPRRSAGPLRDKRRIAHVQHQFGLQVAVQGILGIPAAGNRLVHVLNDAWHLKVPTH